MKTVIANSYLEVMVNCPYCDNYQDILDDVRYDLDNTLRAKDMATEIKCEECGKNFYVKEVQY